MPAVTVFDAFAILVMGSLSQPAQWVLEAVAKGVVLALGLALASATVPGAFSSAPAVALTGAAVAAAQYVLFELTGMNTRYCVIGWACRRSRQ